MASILTQVLLSHILPNRIYAMANMISVGLLGCIYACLSGILYSLNCFLRVKFGCCGAVVIRRGFRLIKEILKHSYRYVNLLIVSYRS